MHTDKCTDKLIQFLPIWYDTPYNLSIDIIKFLRSPTERNASILMGDLAALYDEHLINEKVFTYYMGLCKIDTYKDIYTEILQQIYSFNNDYLNEE